MGFPDDFEIPVSDTQAYRQFGNSVVVPLVEEVARAMLAWENSARAVSELYVAMARQMQRVVELIEYVSLQERRTDEMITAMKTAIDDGEAVSKFFADKIMEMDMVTGHLSRILETSPQPFSSLDLVNLFTHTAKRDEADLTRSLDAFSKYFMDLERRSEDTDPGGHISQNQLIDVKETVTVD